MTKQTSRQPAEWEPHQACWLAWPSAADLWQGNLTGARREFRALCETIADFDPATGALRGESLRILVHGAESQASAQAELGHLNPVFHVIPFGDIWLRDTAPIFTRGADRQIANVRFGFNGWGGKYVLDHDDRVASAIARVAGVPSHGVDLVLEGGSIDVDGHGTGLTTRECLLNANRNPTLAPERIEALVCEALGLRKLLWLGDGLRNDHTDGHIDNIARFVAPGRVACMKASGADDPNRATLDQIARDLASFTDAEGRAIEVVRIPSPGKVLNDEGDVVPASHMNFYVANTTVAVPLYGTPYDSEAVAAIASLFPGRRTVGLPARHILSGGGSFHCITQQQPAK